VSWWQADPYVSRSPIGTCGCSAVVAFLSTLCNGFLICLGCRYVWKSGAPRRSGYAVLSRDRLLTAHYWIYVFSGRGELDTKVPLYRITGAARRGGCPACPARSQRSRMDCANGDGKALDGIAVDPAEPLFRFVGLSARTSDRKRSRTGFPPCTTLVRSLLVSCGIPHALIVFASFISISAHARPALGTRASLSIGCGDPRPAPACSPYSSSFSAV